MCNCVELGLDWYINVCLCLRVKNKAKNVENYHGNASALPCRNTNRIQFSKILEEITQPR